MAADPSFPPPLSQLGKSGISVAAAPTGGMGMALTPDGKLPLGVLFTNNLGDNAPRRIAVGSGLLTWPGATAVSSVLTVPHDLGVAPAAVVATMAGATAPAFFVMFSWNTNGTTTSFSIVGMSPAVVPAAGQTASFSFLAVG